MAKDSVSSLLTSVDELFTTQEERDIAKRETVMDIPLAEISDFPNHPFKVTVDEKMLEMADSVKRYGVLVPAIVRPKQGGGYEMIAGHRRKKASELAERPTLNCIVRDLTDDEAIIIMVDSNLQRELILPSEKAFAYKMKLDAMKRQGHRTDLTSCPVGEMNLPESVRKMIESEDLSSGHAKVLLGLPNQDAMEKAAIQIVSRDLSVRETEKLVKMMEEASSKQSEEEKISHDVDHTRSFMGLMRNLNSP